MTPQAMPEAPAAIAVLSITRTSWPPPSPRRRRFSARCQAVLRPWMPAPMTTYLTCDGRAMAEVFPFEGRGARAVWRPTGLTEPGEHFNHKPARFQTNFLQRFTNGEN